MPTADRTRTPERPLRLALVVAHYPTPSQTFIDRLVLALSTRSELDVTVLVSGAYDRAGATRVLGDALESGRVCVRWVGGARRPGVRAAFGVAHALVGCVRAPMATLRTLDLRRYGARAARLRLTAMARLVRAGAPYDVVHAQFLGLGLDVAGAYEALGTGTPRLLSSVRGADLTRAGAVGAHDDALLRRTPMTLLPVSVSLAERLQEHGVPSERVRVVPSGLDIDAVPFVPYAERASSDAWRLVFVGRLVPKKGLDVLLEALARWRVTAGASAVRLDVVGDGPMAGRWRAQAAAAGMGELVVFHGAADAGGALAALRAADVAVVPSRTGLDGDEEGIPNVAKEAMASGTIVVASDHGGLRELIAPGVTGYVFPEGSVDGCLDALRRCHADRARWPEIAARAREAVEQGFAVDAMVAPLLAAYGATPARTDERGPDRTRSWR